MISTLPAVDYGPECCPGGVRGYGNLQAQVMFVGIAPGKDEWTQSRRPFTGQSGQLLDALLAACCPGLTRDDVYTTNLICWWNDTPNEADMDVCASRLAREIALVKPKLLIPMGVLASERLLGRRLVTARGAVSSMGGNHYAMATYHPAAALHEDPLHPQQQIDQACNLVRDFQKIVPVLEGYYDAWQQEHITYDVLDNLQRAQQVLDGIPQGTLVAVDIETNYDKDHEKYHPFDHDIISVAISSNTRHAWVLTADVLSAIKWPTHLRYAWHHGQFDTIELRRKFGYWLPIDYDTMLANYVGDERKGIHRLKPMSREYTGADYYEETEHKVLPGQPVSPELYKYNAQDAVHTYRHTTRQPQLMCKANTYDYYNNMLIPAANMLAESQYYGINVDLPTNMQAGKEIALEKTFLDLDLQEQARALGWNQAEDINVGSPQQLAYLLYDVMHLRVPQAIAKHMKTPRSTDKNVLAALNHPFCEGVLRSRELMKAGSSYILAARNDIKFDGRIHPIPHLHGTVNARLTYTKPAIQVLPKEKSGDTLSRTRRQYMATTPDHFLLEADYAQIEAKVGDYFSGDPTLHEDIYSADWHTATAEGMFSTSKDQFDLTDPTQLQQWKHYRDGAKHVNYGSMYMEGANGLTRVPPIGLGCDLRTARDYINRWKARYPVFVAWQQEQIRQAWAKGYIQDPWGHKRHFPLRVNSHQDRQAGNALIQMTAGHYTLNAALILWPLLKQYDTTLLFIEHDALYYEGPLKYLKEVALLIKQVMEAPPLPGCGLPSIAIETVVGDSLYSMKDYHYAA